MESRPNGKAAAARVHEEFEPSTDWIREPGADTLRIYLPGFKKEQLKVQVTSSRVLRVSGERQLSGTRWSTFRKEIPISSNYDTNEIAASSASNPIKVGFSLYAEPRCIWFSRTPNPIEVG
ncbi:hypothetical protein H0E87_007684 [Populus deltoides]|uniref:SHSP domain-containing protein n=1 Tax=Populus deltoides TaxID=3696 RepID=A0A8T2YXW6_POPDE|nr:hypothetical protein H0E87_007684 [Populus deltoides]